MSVQHEVFAFKLHPFQSVPEACDSTLLIKSGVSYWVMSSIDTQQNNYVGHLVKM